MLLSLSIRYLLIESGLQIRVFLEVPSLYISRLAIVYTFYTGTFINSRLLRGIWRNRLARTYGDECRGARTLVRLSVILIKQLSNILV